MKNNQLLVLEGVDGSGKTTVARGLVEQTGAVYLKTPGSEFKGVRHYVDNGTPKETKLLYYLSSVFDASRKIEESLQNQDVICDRYIWSSFIPHSAYYDVDLSKLESFWKPMTSKLVQPDHTVLLTVDEELQLERMKKDNGRDLTNPSASDGFCLDTKKRRAVRNLYEQIAKRDSWVVVDTIDKSPSEIVSEINERTSLGVAV